MRSLIFAGALALTLGLTACQTPHSFPNPDATWQAHIGQLKYSNRKRTLIGDVVVQQRGSDQFQLDFIKGGGLPLVSVRQDAFVSHTEGLLVHGSWQGSPNNAPQALQAWLRLRDAFVQAAGGGASRSAHVESKFSGGHLSMLFVAFPDNERFVFEFNR
jgi:hypothetical protein